MLDENGNVVTNEDEAWPADGVGVGESGNDKLKTAADIGDFDLLETPRPEAEAVDAEKQSKLNEIKSVELDETPRAEPTADGNASPAPKRPSKKRNTGGTNDGAGAGGKKKSEFMTGALPAVEK